MARWRALVAAPAGRETLSGMPGQEKERYQMVPNGTTGSWLILPLVLLGLCPVFCKKPTSFKANTQMLF